MQPFTIHWSQVSGATDGMELFALWPSPMNLDACFKEAGFTDFDDADDNWDANAAGLLTRLLEALSNYGPPRLMSEPAVKYQPWYRRLFTKPEVFDLREQIELPFLWDQLPDCIVAFGESGVSLRTSRGHHVFWITWPHSDATAFPNLAGRLAASHPIVRTELRWEGIIPVGRGNPHHR